MVLGVGVEQARAQVAVGVGDPRELALHRAVHACVIHRPRLVAAKLHQQAALFAELVRGGGEPAALIGQVALAQRVDFLFGERAGLKGARRGVTGVDAGGELGAAGGERLLLRGGGGERKYSMGNGSKLITVAGNCMACACWRTCSITAR